MLQSIKHGLYRQYFSLDEENSCWAPAKRETWDTVQTLAGILEVTHQTPPTARVPSGSVGLWPGVWEPFGESLKIRTGPRHEDPLAVGLTEKQNLFLSARLLSSLSHPASFFLFFLFLSFPFLPSFLPLFTSSFLPPFHPSLLHFTLIFLSFSFWLIHNWNYRSSSFLADQPAASQAPMRRGSQVHLDQADLFPVLPWPLRSSVTLGKLLRLSEPQRHPL